MSYIPAIIGLAVGCCEIVLTGTVTDSVLLDKNKKRLPLYAALKLAIYAISVAAVLLIPSINAVYLGIGFGVGMVSGCAVFLILKNRKAAKKESRKPDGNDKE